MLRPAPSIGKTEPRTLKKMFYDLWEATGVKPQELIDHPIEPPHFEWVWDWFIELPTPVTWTEIKSWSWASGLKPSRWEGELLISLDNLRNN